MATGPQHTARAQVLAREADRLYAHSFPQQANYTLRVAMFHLELAKIAATVANKYTTPYLDGSIFEVEYSADWAEAFRREED